MRRNTLALIYTLTASILLMSNNGLAATLKISTAYPDGTYVVKSLKAAAKKIATETDNRVKIKFYPGGVQGDKKTVLKKIKRGILHGSLLEGSALSSDYKDSQVYNAPMAFSNYDEVDHVRHTMDPILIAELKKVGWHTFGLIDGGFAYAMTNKPVNSIDTLKEQKLWLPANDPLSEKVASSLGLSPIYLGIGEVLTALQTGAINAIAAPPGAALTLQWYSRVKYVTDAPFMYTFGILAISKKAMGKLSDADRKKVDTIFGKAVADIDKNARKDNINAFDALKSQGINVVSLSVKDANDLKNRANLATEVLQKKGEFSEKALTQMLALIAEKRNKK